MTVDVREPLFTLTPFDEIAFTSSVRYLVKGLLPRVGLVIVWGPPKCGKSFWVFDLVMHVALGWEYRGHRVRKGPAVYCALEGTEGFKARVEAFRQAKLVEIAEEIPFYLMTSPLELVRDHSALIAAIRLQLGERNPATVVIDTLNRSITGSESDDEAMTAYIRAADAIRDAFNCLVVIVHHCGHEGTRPRGHSSLGGALDVQISVKKSAAGLILAELELAKDIETGLQLASKLRIVEVGVDDDGDAITSCVIDAAGDGPAGGRRKTSAKLPNGARIALKALRDAIDDCSEIPPASSHIPTKVEAVKIETWRAYAEKAGITSSDEKDAFRKAFQRAHETLVAEGYVGVWTPWVWLA